MDVIELRGLRVLGTHGVLEEEQCRAQPFEVDLDIGADLEPAAASDRIADTIDYGRVCQLVDSIVGGEPCQLLERVAGRIADAVLTDDRVRWVTVTLRKLRPPVPVDLASAGVRVTRGRSSANP